MEKITTIKRDGSEYRALKTPKLNRILQVGGSGTGFPALEKLRQADLCKFQNSQHCRETLMTPNPHPKIQSLPSRMDQQLLPNFQGA